MGKYFSDLEMLFICIASVLIFIAVIDGSQASSMGEGAAYGGGSRFVSGGVNCNDSINQLACDEVYSFTKFLRELRINDVNVNASSCANHRFISTNTASQFGCKQDGNTSIWHITWIVIQGMTSYTGGTTSAGTSTSSTGGTSTAVTTPHLDLSSLKQLLSLNIFDIPLIMSSISHALIKLDKLQELMLWRNGLTGPIPSELALLKNLRRLVLSENSLKGPIPPEIGNLSTLTRLELYNNQLSGPIPPALGNLSMLTYLDLSSNQLTGEIPENFKKLSNLKTLLLNWNLLNGSASTVGNLSSLVNLDLSNNNFSGEIPKSLGKLIHLEKLLLDDNLFSGNIPHELGNLMNLAHISFSANNLNGPLPESFSNLTRLVDFVADGNYLTGRIPDTTNWNSIVFLDLLGNNFNGSFPDGIFMSKPNLTRLWISDLQTDPFKLPTQANLPNLRHLVLRNCSIKGTIPANIANWNTGLRYLDLSFNQLEGNIPDSLKNTSLTALYLAGNNLSGSIPDWFNKKLITNRTDLSFNNFIDEGLNENKVPGLQMNFTELPINLINEITIKDMRNSVCKHHARNTKLAINSGGAAVRINGTNYEADQSLLKHSLSESKNWAYTCSGDFISDGYNRSAYIKKITCSTNVLNEPLHTSARLCPEELTYYGFCFTKGSYTVKLYFAEIAYANYFDYSIWNKRVFDVYVQDKRILKDFNIKESAGGPNIEYMYPYKDARVKDNLLTIRLVWKGKGSIYNEAFNGPLISAIVVTPNFLLTKIQTAVVVVASLIGLVIVSGFLWRTGVIGDRNTRRKVVQLHDKNYSLKELSAATEKYSDKREIGKAGLFGTVYKAEFPDQKVYAVKKLHVEFMEQHRVRIRDDFFILKCLDHVNIVPLLDGYSKGDLTLLIYEYMEGGSLETALFDAESGSVLQNNWKARLKVSKDVVKGLKYLHEDSKLQITHGDIKAENVLLDGSNPPTAKLSDYGLARFYEEENPFSVARDKRNIQYIATGQGATVPTVKADIYSFGVLLLEIISGKRALEDDATEGPQYLLPKAIQLLRKNNTEELVDSKLNINIEDKKQAVSLVELAIRCVDVVPDQRPTISKILFELESAEKGHIYSSKAASSSGAF